MFKQKINFKNSRNLNLSAIFEGEDRDAAVVVICHGYESSKDSISQRDLRKSLVESGLSVFSFDFTGCGQSDGSITDLTPLQGLDDLKSAIQAVRQSQFALYGSSYGGHVALLYASKNPILALALKAPVSDYLWVAKNTEPSIRRKAWAQELENINIYEIAKNIKVPTLIVHGDKDDIVPLDQSRRLLKSLGSKDKELKITKGGLHSMRGKAMEEAHHQIADFFRKTLS